MKNFFMQIKGSNKLAGLSVFLLALYGCSDQSSVSNDDFYMGLSPNVRSVFDFTGIDEQGDFYFVSIEKREGLDTRDKKISISISNDLGGSFVSSDVDSYRWNDGFSYLHSSSFMKVIGSKLDANCNCSNYRPVHYYSLDDGFSWRQLSIPSGYIWKVLPLEHPFNSLLSIGAAGGIFDLYKGYIARSHDGGETWFNLNNGVLDSVIAAGLASYPVDFSLNVSNLEKSQCNSHRNWISFTMPSTEGGELGLSMEHAVLSYSDSVGDTWKIVHQSDAEYPRAQSFRNITENCLSNQVYFLVPQKGGLTEVDLVSKQSRIYFDNSSVENLKVNKGTGSVYAIVEGELKRKGNNSASFYAVSHGIGGVQRYDVHADDDLRILITDKVNGLHYTKDGGDNWVKLSGGFETLTPLIGSEGFAPIEPYFIAGKDDLVLLKVRSYVGDWENRREYSKGLYYSLSGY